jgi:hypothetical protein
MDSISIVPNSKRFVKEKSESGISPHPPGIFGVCTLQSSDGGGGGFPTLSHATPFFHLMGAEVAHGNERSGPLSTNLELTFGLRKRCFHTYIPKPKPRSPMIPFTAISMEGSPCSPDGTLTRRTRRVPAAYRTMRAGYPRSQPTGFPNTLNISRHPHAFPLQDYLLLIYSTLLNIYTR